MKKVATVFLLVSSFLFCNYSTISAQCQLCYLNEEQSKMALEYLSNCKEIILYSACERGDIARRVKITEVYTKPADRTGKFTTWIKGKAIATFDISEGNRSVKNYVKINSTLEEEVDLAYLHTRNTARIQDQTGEIIWDAACLGIVLGFECNPCTDPFDYPTEPLGN